MDRQNVLPDSSRLRVAFVAHELSPNQGSECAGGWRLLLQLTERHPELEIAVFCAEGPQHLPHKYSDDISRWLQMHGPLVRVTFFYVPYGKIASRFISANFSRMKFKGGIGNPILYFLAYRMWQRRAMRTVNHQNNISQFDLLHIVNLITLREPGSWHKMNIPLVWGPTGGVLSVPWSYLRSLPIAVQARELLRQFSWFLPSFKKRRVLQTIGKAKHVFFFDRREAEWLGLQGRASHLADSACDQMSLNKTKAGSSLHIIVVGQLVARKMPWLLMLALTQIPDICKKVKVSYVGTGPLEDELKATASALGLNNIEFRGNVDYESMNAIYSSADLLVHPSFREAGSHVVPEALSFGVPVVCHALGGLDFFVDDTCGVLIPLVDEATSIGAIARAIARLSINPQELTRLSHGAILRAKSKSWPAMADRVAEVYRVVALGGSQ